MAHVIMLVTHKIRLTPTTKINTKHQKTILVKCVSPTIWNVNGSLQINTARLIELVQDLLWESWHPGPHASEGQWQWLKWLSWFVRVPSLHALYCAFKMDSISFLIGSPKKYKEFHFYLHSMTTVMMIKCNTLRKMLNTVVTIQSLQEVIGLTLTSQLLPWSADQTESSSCFFLYIWM